MKSLKKSWFTYGPYGLVVAFAAFVIYIYWPGFMSPDTMGQLQQALTKTYSDHHPPLMALYWGLWVWWKQGPEPIFLTHQILLWGSACLFIRAFQGKRIAWIYPFIPLVPHVLFYSGATWKDAGFSFSYLFAAALMTLYGVHQRRPGFFGIGVIFVLLFYGTGVKYQALFVLPVMCLWMGVLLTRASSQGKGQASFLIMSSFWGVILLALWGVQWSLRNSHKENHSWQFVKLYDLAGISVQLNTSLFPPFVEQAPEFSFEKVRSIYSSYRVDELLAGWAPGAPLIAGQTPRQREKLWRTWAHAVLDHPSAYLKHRFGVWTTMIGRSPLKSLDELKDVKKVPSKIQFLLGSVGDKGLAFLKELTRFVYYVPLLLFYFILGLWQWRRSPQYAIPLAMMNGAGLTLLSVLFIFSMASDLRYIYLTMCFFHFSHGLAYSVLKEIPLFSKVTLKLRKKIKKKI